MPPTRLVSRALVRLSPEEPGEDVRGFLQGLVTADVMGDLPAWSGLLNAQGKAEFDFIIWPEGAETLLLDCETDAADNLVTRLKLYRLRRKIAITRATDLAVHWSPDAGTGVEDPRLAALGHRWLTTASGDGDGADAAWLAHRLSLGVPEGRAELAGVLWLETNAAELNGVNFNKGCYVGQENTARMNWRQKVNRRLVVVPLVQSDPARRKAEYPQLGLAVDHLQIANVDPALLPEWQRTAIAL